MLDTSECPKSVVESSLSQILEAIAPSKYSLSKKACLGILRRSDSRGKPLPPELKTACMIQAGLIPMPDCGVVPLPLDTQAEAFTAGFCAGAGASAGSIAYQKESAPTLKGSPSGNMMPTVLCLNDQGGRVMEVSENVTGTLRAQEHGHQPLVLYENHGIDARYTGPHEVAPTLSARTGTGGNNLPIVEHRVFARQRCDHFNERETASTVSARQYKDATDLVYDDPYARGSGGQSQANEDGAKKVMLLRRLMPVECEKLQGYPPHWTALPNARDAPRYRALGNSVAVPCVDYLIQGVALAILADR